MLGVMENDAEEHHEYLKNQIKLCKIWDLWPIEDKSILRRMLQVSFIATNVVSFIGLIGIFMLTIVTNFGNIDGLAKVVEFATVTAASFFRYCHILIYGEEYQKLARFMYDNFLHETTDKTINMNKYFQKGTVFCLCYLVCGIFFGSQLLTISLVKYFYAEPEMQQYINFLPLNLTYPFDMSPLSINIILSFQQCFVICQVVVNYSIIDGFWWMAIILTITQYNIISHNLKNMDIILNMEGSKAARRELRQSIKCHQTIRRFILKIENLFSRHVLVDFMHAIVSITFILLDATIAMNVRNWVKLIYLGVFFLMSIVHMFVISWLGSEVVSKEEELCRALYDTPWYKMSLKFKKDMYMSSIGAKRPCRFTGGHMFTVNLEFFMTSLKMIFSYFMFLMQLRDGQ